MRRFLGGLGGAFLGCTLIWLVGFHLQRDVPTETSRWVFDAQQLKMAAAEAASGPRILVVAGSNALFGIDSAQIEAHWQRPAINLAINAGLRLPYILATSRRIARPGDIILLPIEYGLYLYDGKPSPQIIDYALARDPAYLDSLSLAERFRFALEIAPERWLRGLRVLPDPPVTSGTYGVHHIDRKGDQTHTQASDQTPAEKAEVAAAKPRNYGARARQEIDGWALLADYSRWAKTHNICLIAIPSAFLQQTEYETNPVEHDFYETLPARVRATGIPYYGRPQDFMYAADRFFNTDYHLQAWARTQHTAQLLKLLGPDPTTHCATP